MFTTTKIINVAFFPVKILQDELLDSTLNYKFKKYDYEIVYELEKVNRNADTNDNIKLHRS